MQVDSRGERAVIGELSLLKSSADVKVGAGVAPLQGSTPNVQLPRRELNAGCERVPMHLLFGRSRCRGQSELKILRDQSPRQRWRRERASRNAVERRRAIDLERKIRRPA